ncbi:MAG TPA: acyl carrier protein [Alphaproteobacteria bacterium]|nr:acyl carrier protein [Alphaproteobacteria bacterium]
MPLEDRIRSFVLDQIGGQADPARIGDTDSLLASGLLDSLQALAIVEFLEAEFGVGLEPDDMVGENFDSVAAIAALVRRRGADRP